MKDIKLRQAMAAEDILNQIRGWLKLGATIRARDKDGPVLEILPDGSCNGNLHIDFGKSSCPRTGFVRHEGE